METDLGFIQLILQIVAFPFQLIEFIVFSLGDFLVFDLFGLGPFLPITL
jgi:hypothetical protein